MKILRLPFLMLLAVLAVVGCEAPFVFEVKEQRLNLSPLSGRHMILASSEGYPLLFPLLYVDLVNDIEVEVPVPGIISWSVAVDTMHNLVYLQDEEFRLFRAEIGRWEWEEVAQLGFAIQRGARMDAKGEYFYFISNGGGLIRLKVGESALMQVLPEETWVEGFDLHPQTGQCVFLLARQGGAREIWLANADGSQPRYLLSPDNPDPAVYSGLSRPRWQAQGNAFFYLDRSNDRLYSFDVDTGIKERNISVPAGIWDLRKTVCVSPDAGQILLPDFYGFILAIRNDNQTQYSQGNVTIEFPQQNGQVPTATQVWWW